LPGFSTLAGTITAGWICPQIPLYSLNCPLFKNFGEKHIKFNNSIHAVSLSESQLGA
jgi:hypothetical protein